MGEGIDSLHDVSKITRGCGMGVNGHARSDEDANAIERSWLVLLSFSAKSIKSIAGTFLHLYTKHRLAFASHDERRRVAAGEFLCRTRAHALGGSLLAQRGRT
jgi:hypothetical protein